jgi:hypothetical protein
MLQLAFILFRFDKSITIPIAHLSTCTSRQISYGAIPSQQPCMELDCYLYNLEVHWRATKCCEAQVPVRCYRVYGLIPDFG